MKLQAGLYFGRVVRQATGVTTNGTPQIVITFALAAQDGYETVRNIYLYDTPRARRRTSESLRELGFYGDVRALNRTGVTQESLVGRACHLICTHEMYAGKWREKWAIAIARNRGVGMSGLYTHAQ